ncbi:tRNA (adenosine(37)-N6)-threonylcarbamoyltransferase complex dimerization subunit type 1 TsaB [Solicola gregarius]|uniref:tRNA (Adenosine(37)-N6)-threonylcarbamoyltransferase complex dimerization subunit type 1 TsaB n=1 Tax=Solicola gregarius TaxID=2908642 RepID=A0AA46TM82_9ACTN|nr:tRNA (adenosine(37)-N6)-threonylcarbamoyltransferase complex dimerization subunit type 1 TsaB [Solicola gregarius]UYM07876.1 tRNA (adenosine(37)-N6)-threonylcarbamoyltransferase complex dimerization subunit type 1 TsaB [Solicola gregarius]
MLLAFDTASPAITVALHDGNDVLAATDSVDAMRHGELLAPGIQRVLAEAGADRRDLTDVAVGVGPGPYTGLRVGVVTARTLAAALSVALHSVCSLDIIAAAVPAGSPFVVATDARRKEVYWARYDATGARVTGPDVARPDALDHPTAMPAYGRGAKLYADALPYAGGPLDPDARVLAEAVAHDRVREVDPEPMYLRRPDATPPGSVNERPDDRSRHRHRPGRARRDRAPVLRRRRVV